MIGGDVRRKFRILNNVWLNTRDPNGLREKVSMNVILDSHQRLTLLPYAWQLRTITSNIMNVDHTVLRKNSASRLPCDGSQQTTRRGVA